MSNVRRTVLYIAGRAPVALVLFVLGVATVEAGRTAVGWWDDWQASRIERSDVFEYVSVEYSGSLGPNGELMMLSTAAWYRHVDRIEWLDSLVCGGTWSSQTFERGERDAEPMQVIEWPYAEAWPDDGRECFMVSVITADVAGRSYVQRIESAPFTPGESFP